MLSTTPHLHCYAKHLFIHTLLFKQSFRFSGSVISFTYTTQLAVLVAGGLNLELSNDAVNPLRIHTQSIREGDLVSY